MTLIRILFIGANVSHDPRYILRINSEHEQIIQSLEDSTDRFTLIPSPDATRERLRDLIVQHHPHIIHFSGHGTFSDGPLLEGDRVGDQSNFSSLVNVIKNYSDTIRIVIFNICKSRIIAEEIIKYIDIVIATKRNIFDSGAIKFAETFYTQLKKNEPIINCFAEADNEYLKIESREPDSPYLPLKINNSIFNASISSIFKYYNNVLMPNDRFGSFFENPDQFLIYNPILYPHLRNVNLDYILIGIKPLYPINIRINLNSSNNTYPIADYFRYVNILGSADFDLNPDRVIYFSEMGSQIYFSSNGRIYIKFAFRTIDLDDFSEEYGVQGYTYSTKRLEGISGEISNIPFSNEILQKKSLYGLLKTIFSIFHPEQDRNLVVTPTTTFYIKFYHPNLIYNGQPRIYIEGSSGFYRFHKYNHQRSFIEFEGLASYYTLDKYDQLFKEYLKGYFTIPMN